MESRYAKKFDELARPFEKRLKVCKVVTVIFWMVEIILSAMLIQFPSDRKIVGAGMLIIGIFYILFSLQVTFKTKMKIFNYKTTADMIREYIQECQLDSQDVLEMDSILFDMEKGICTGDIDGIKFTFTDTLLVSCSSLDEFGVYIEVVKASSVKTVKIHHYMKDFRGYSFDMNDYFSLDFDSDDQSIYNEVVRLIEDHYPDVAFERLPDEE